MAWERRGRRPLLNLAFLLVISFRVKADNLEVKRLQRIDTHSINIFCTTTNGVTPDDAKDQYELSFESPPSGRISLVSTSEASSNPQVFEVNVEDLYGSQTVFTLELKTKEDQAVKASSDVAFTLADVSGVKASWVGTRKLSEPGEVLRLYGHPVRVLACPEGGEDNKDCLDFPKEQSYQASSGLSGAAAVLCVPTEGDPAVPFCLVTVDITTAAGITYGGEVRLSHQEDQTAPAEGTLSVAKDIGAGEKRDLLYWSDGRLLACLGTTSCMIQDFPSSNNQYDVFFVDYQEADGEITGASLVMKFEDYSPIGTVIEPNTLEMRWTQTRNQYKLLLTDIEGQEVTITEPPFTSAVVNCEDMKECFGYFINLPPGDFKVMVRPWTGSNMLEENSVLSSKQTIQNSKSKSSDLKIQEVHLDWSSDGSKAFPKVCFTNKAVTSKNLSHFELVIVDQKGHWIRSRGATQKTEGVTCFTGVTLSSDELLIPGKVTVIVIERDLDGLNVVASAHAEAFFKRSLDLVITKFEITDIKSQKFSIHYTGPSGTLSGGELSAMNIDAARIINMELTGVSETRADFEASDLLMSWIKYETQLTWVLRLHAVDGNFVYGEEQFTFPDVVTFPTCDPAHLIGKKQVVRISCDHHSLETDTIQMTDDDLAIQASTGVTGVSYHLLDKPATLPASIQLCRKPVDNGNVDICTRQVELKDATAGVTAMTEIKVEYEAKITVQHTPSDGNSLDGLVYYYQEDPNPPTLKYCPRADCEVQGYIGVQDLEVLVVYKDDTTGKSVESEQRTVYGLELRGAQITSTVSELAIKKMPERDVYQVIIENSTSPGMEVRSPTFTTVKVMCQDVEIVCYAYLPLTAGGKYKATVSPYEDKAGEGAPDKMNQIVSLEMTPLQYKEKRDTEVPKNLVLKQINRVKSDTATFGTDVTVFNDLEPVDGIASVTLVVTHENGDGTGDEHLLISTEVGDGIIEQGVEEVFHFDINPVDNILSPPTTVLFIAKNKDNDALAVAEVTVEFKTLDPTMDWVGGADTAPLRVKTDLDVEINGVPFAAGTSYSLDFESDPNPVEVCATLDNTDPAGGTVRQCDLTRSIGSYKDMDVDEVELNIDDAKRVMTVKSTFGGMEAVLYKEEDNGIVGVTFFCTSENICSSEISDELMVELSRVFKVLVVGKDGTDLVTGAKVVDFEDFQTYVQRFSDGSDLEVRWEASNNNGFTVQLDNDVPDGFTDVAVQCGGAEQRACKAYFTNLKADASYKAKVIKENTAVSFTTPATAGSAVPLSITQLSEVSTNPLQMELKVSSGEEVTGVEYIEYVVIDPPVDGEAEQRIVFKDTVEDIKTGDNSITFDDAELPDAGAGSTVLAVVHGPGGVLAAGKVVAAFKAINPTMSWVGEANTAPLRVKTDLAVEINGVLFAAGTSYSLDFESAPNPVEVCATLENTAPAGGTVRQCDMTRSIQDFQELNVDNIELNYDAGKHVMTVSSTFAGMEAVLYHGGDTGIVSETFSCDTANTCSSPDISGQISGLSPAFKVLVVGVDAGAVTGANVVDFEDFQVRVQRFSAAGDLEVRWRADSAETYKIHLDADVPDGFTDVSVACGGAEAADNRACKAYFTKLEADKPYKAELQRGITVVSATVPAIPGTYTPVTISRIAEVSRTPLQTQLTFSSGAEVTGVEYIECVVIDPPADGKATQRIVFKDTNEGIAEGDNDITFDVGELPNPGAESTVLVVVHGPDGVDSDALAAGKVVVTFQVIKPTMTWVGGPDTAPLRIETSLKLDVNGNACDAGTSYILDFEANPSPPELCVALVDAVEGGTVLQCDGTQAIQNAGDLSINTVELNYDAGKHVMTVSSTFAGMEAVLYHGGDTGVVPETFSCDTPDTCSSPDISGQISGLSPAFKVLVVGVDAGAVTGAKVVDFEDFQVRVQRFSGTGDLEVRWRADSVETYEIHLDADVPDGFTDVSVACGGADNRACKAYFTKLEAEKPYKAELQRGITVVSATVPAGQESGIPVTITKIAQVSKDPLQTQLTVTADTEVIGIEYLEFVVIEPLSDNEATQHLTFKSVNCIINVDTTAVFDVEELPSTGVELTLLFVVHGRDGVDSEALAAGKVVVTLADIKPTINWVGGQDTAPLRIHANQELLINNIQFPEGTFYLLDFDASSNIEICVTLDNTAATGTTLNQCDLTQTPQNVADMEVQKVELSHEAEGKSTITVSSTFTSMEAVMYNAGESGKVSESFSCVTENTCSSDVTTILAELKTTFKFLAVGVADPDAVSGAKLIDVEDFQTSALRFSDSGVVEVRWRASSDQLFNVHVNNEGSEGFTDVSVQCGGSEQRACKAYYTMLKANMAYKAEVQKDIVAVSTAVPATTASVTTLNIARISKMSESPMQTQLTVSAATEVTGIQYVDFVMIDPPKDNIAPQHIAFSEAPDSIDANSCFITFDDTDQPKMLVEVTVLVVAHGAEGSDSDILASGEVHVYFADLVPPKMTKVGSEETKSLKVENGDLDVRVNGNVCRAKSVCYFLESDTYLEPPEVCRDTGSGVEQCDMTGSYVVKKLLAVTGLDLMDKGLPEKELRVTADFDANSVTMETMIYDDAGIETSTPLTCNIESASCVFPVAPQNTIFKILLMALDNKAGVVESNTIEFEDFQTRMEQLTNTDLEVSWKSSQASNFTITMNPPPEGFPSVLTVECGGEQPEDSAKCLAFFLLLPEGAGCTANVNRKGDNAKTVSAFLQLDIAEGFSAPITITRLIARERAGKKPSLSVCFKDELFANGKGGEVMTRAGSPKYSLVVVDAFGRQLLSPSDLSSLSSSSSVEDDLCFGDLSLGFDFDLRQKLKVIVKREEMEGERVRAVGDIEAHLLDPRGLIDVRQVGPRTVRVGWKDVHRALGYEVLIGALRLAGGCDGEQDPQCVRYLHVDRGESPLVVTLKAVDARVSQEVEVPLPLLDMSTLRIYSTALTDENRLQVCFNPAPKASHYLLSLEDEKGLVLESRRVFPQQEDDFTCVLSAEEVDLGGYLSLRTLVTAFDASDMPVASGTATIQEFFLSSKRKVLTVVNETNHDLITTWHLLDDPEKITSYYVTLERATDGRKNDPVVLSSTVTSHVFEGVAPGRYSVCVAASVEDAGSILRSREVCSDIFSVPGVDVEIPEVAEVKVKTTGLDKALVTWQKPGDEDDVTNYVITWTKAAPSSNSAVSSTSNQARPRHPLPIVAQGFRDVEPDFRDQGRHHRIVPASSPSVEVLTLDPKKAYEVCVSAVRKGVAGNHVCKEVQLGKDDPVDSPTDLVFENDLLKWNEVVSASGYLVEWRPRRGGISSGGQEEVKTTSWTSGNLSPGRWVVSVRATTETSASKAVSADYLKEGIEIVSAVQPNNNQLLIRWQEEPRPPCAESKCHYAITTSYNQAPLWHSCSGLKGDCERAIEVQGGTQVEVALERDGVKSSRKEMVFAFPAMSDLNQRSSSGGRGVTVSWRETGDARLYNVTLFSDSSRSSVKLTEMLKRESFTLHEDEVEGSVLLIQPCADKTHCGSGQNITVTSATDTPSRNIPGLVASVVGGVLFLVVVALVVTVVILKRVKRKEVDDTRRLEEVTREHPMSSQRSIGLHSSVQAISMSALSHEETKQQ